MNNQDNRDWERKLQELEKEIDKTPLGAEIQPGQPLSTQSERSELNSSLLLNKIVTWFNGLSSGGRIVAIAVGAIVGFAVLRTVFQLVASLISLAVLGVLVYAGYKFWIAKERRN